MKSSRIILILSVFVATAAAALGFTAFNLARHEQQFRSNEIRNILKSECTLMADRLDKSLQQFRNRLISDIRKVLPDSRSADRLLRGNPLIRGVFISNLRGDLDYSTDRDGFVRRYKVLFRDFISAENGRKVDMLAYNMAPPAKTQDTYPSGDSSWFGFSRRQSSNCKIQFKSQQVAEADVRQDISAVPQKSKSRTEQKNGSGRLVSRFGLLVDGKDSGWINWFAGNEFCPLVWVKKNGKIVGAEVEMIAILSRLVTLFPQNFPRYYRFELVNSQGKCLYASGYSPGSSEELEKLEPAVFIPVAGKLVPNWQVRGYIVPEMQPQSNIKFMLSLQIGSFLLVIAACGVIMLWMVRRELVLAGQKTSFVANVSHELKTPLTSIRMYAEMLKDNADRLAVDKRTKYLSVILGESERLSRLISNVLNFSRIEAGKKKYNPVEIELNGLMSELVENWRPTFAEKKMKLIYTGTEEPVAVDIDRDSLVQVIQNLLSNALKYASDGPELGMILKVTASEASIRVIDSGRGIPASAREKIFCKFYRCDDSLTVETSGSGLGLTIARKLMRDQGGDLTCVAAGTGGAEFIITLPLRRKS